MRKLYPSQSGLKPKQMGIIPSTNNKLGQVISRA